MPISIFCCLGHPEQKFGGYPLLKGKRANTTPDAQIGPKTPIPPPEATGRGKDPIAQPFAQKKGCAEYARVLKHLQEEGPFIETRALPLVVDGLTKSDDLNPLPVIHGHCSAHQR